MEEIPDKKESQSRPVINGEALRKQKQELLRKERIISQVESEMTRRRWLLRFYASLLVVGLLLGAVALLFAKPATQFTTQIMKVTDDQLKPVMADIDKRAKDAGDKANQQVLNTTKAANKQLTEMADDTSKKIPTLAAAEVNNQIQPALVRIDSQIANVRATASRLSGFDPKKIDQSIIAANRLNDGLLNINKLTTEQAEQKRNLAEFKGTFASQTRWLAPDATGRPTIFNVYEAQLKRNADLVDNLKGAVDSLKSQVAALQQQVNSLKAGGVATGSQRSSYPVKEDSKAQIYDLDLKIKVGTQKDGVVNRIEIRSTRNRLINGKASLEVKDLEMGSSITFNDGEYTYTLTPIYIQRRRLIKDFIGITIQRERLIVNVPTVPNAQPSATSPD